MVEDSHKLQYQVHHRLHRKHLEPVSLTSLKKTVFKERQGKICTFGTCSVTQRNGRTKQ